MWRWGEREIIYLSLHCHHQNDSCIKMGSVESHFNVSVGSVGQEVQLLQPSSTSLLMISPGTLSVILVRTLSVCTLYYHAALESARVDPIRLTGFRPQTAVLSLRELYNTSRTYLARLEFPPL